MKLYYILFTIPFVMLIIAILIFYQLPRANIKQPRNDYFERINLQKNMSEINHQYQIRTNWLSSHTTWYQHGTHTGWAGFDKVYFISLPERLDNVKEVAKRLGIGDSAWILNAVHKSSLDRQELIDIDMVSEQFFQLVKNNYSAVACQLSHLAVLYDCYNDNEASTCVIFEDDLYKPPISMTSQITDLHQKIDDLEIKWDILFLDYCSEDGGGKTSQDIRWLDGSLCAHAYVVKKDIIPTLIVASTPMYTAIDGVYYVLMKNKYITAIGPDKTRYFGQNKRYHGSSINPALSSYEQQNFRYRYVDGP